MKRSRWNICTCIAGILLAVTMLLQLFARRVPGFAQWYSVTVYRFLVASVGRVTSVFPFSVVEMLLYAFLLAVIAGFFFVIYQVISKRWKVGIAILRAGQTILLTGSVLFFSYTIGCGINYHRTAFSTEAGIVMEESSRKDLIALCEALVEQINEVAPLIATDDEGCLILTQDPHTIARKSMASLGQEYEQLAGFYPNPKGVLVSRIFSVQKLEGVYSPFTLEANYNREMPEVSIPVAICHELSHLRGYMREDEANFIAYLACLRSEEPEFIYSGSVLAFIHSANALYRDGAKDDYVRIYGMLCETAQRDLAMDSAFWKQFDGKVAEVSNKVNDTYLKVNKQEDGVKSYGRMVDLLLAWYREGRS